MIITAIPGTRPTLAALDFRLLDTYPSAVRAVRQAAGKLETRTNLSHDSISLWGFGAGRPFCYINTG